MAFPYDPPPSVIWSLRREQTAASCDMQVLPDGVLVRMLREGLPFIALSFATEADGRTCAEGERQRLTDAGWI